MLNQLIADIASIAIGLCLGLIGAGGSILTIPVFVYVLKESPAASTTYSMFVVGLCSLVGSMQAFIKKLVDVKVAMLFGVPSVAGVFIARKLVFPVLPANLFYIGHTAITRDACIMFALAAIMALVAVKMLRRPPVNPSTQAGDKNNPTPFIVQGLLTGFVTGLLGVGGGFLIVPALLLWVKLPVKAAIGTALFIITINSTVGFAISYTATQVDWLLLIRFCIGAVAGILSGTMLSTRISPVHLKKVLAWFIITTSVYVLYKQFQHCGTVELSSTTHTTSNA